MKVTALYTRETAYENTSERMTCIRSIHEFTPALADMLDKDEELRNTLLRSPHEDISTLAGFYAELSDYTSSAKENSASTYHIDNRSDA